MTPLVGRRSSESRRAGSKKAKRPYSTTKWDEQRMRIE
jgi:hypothetical protein